MLLLDEPFGALDAKVRKTLRRWLRDLHKRMGLTSIFVTHDQEEALELADRVAVILSDVLGEVDLPPGALDRLAAILSYRPDLRSIEAGLHGSGLPAAVIERSIEGVRMGAFKFFKGAGHISVEAACRLSERLLAGDTYDRACAFHGWDHAAPDNSAFAGLARPASPKSVLAIINDAESPPVHAPGARKALGMAFKQFVAIAREFGGLLQLSYHGQIGRETTARAWAEQLIVRSYHGQIGRETTARWGAIRRGSASYHGQIGRETTAEAETIRCG